MSYPPLEELSQLHANICQALADSKRILIIYALYDHPRNVSTLAGDLDLPQPTVSRHLRVLRQQSLVLTERDGPSVIYRLADERIVDALDIMRQVMFDNLEHRSDLLEAV